MRLCVIGTSHVGMLRAAARELGAESPDMVFFAKAGAGLEKATIRGPVIAAEDPDLRAAQARFGMPAAVDVSGFDAVILVGGTASIYDSLRILQDFRVSGWPSESGTRKPNVQQKPLLSEPVFVAALADIAREGLSYRFASTLRQASDVPLFLVPQPFPSERVFESDRPQEFGFQRLRRKGDGTAVSACLKRGINHAYAELAGVTVLDQPAETIAHGFTTKYAYTRDAVRVDGNTPQTAEDLLHVGPAFGRLVIGRVASVRAIL